MNHYKVSVSVIIPCYNASKYLNALADCLLQQDFGDYEAIFINDGDASQDGILEEIANKDRRFKVYRKENGGVSSARNLGLEKAEGEWIVFVDPDDIVKPYFLSSLYNAVNETDADFGQGGYFAYNGKEIQYFEMEKSIQRKKSIDFVEYFNYIEKNAYYKTCWAKIFKKEIIENQAIRFDTRFSMGEDWTFVLMYYKHTNNVAIVENCGYCYNWSPVSGLSSKYDPTHMQFTLESVELLSFLRQRIGRSDVHVKADKDKDYTNLCFSFLKNLYCTKGHPSLHESIQLIKNQLLSNEVLLIALKSTNVQKKTDKIQKMLIMTGNATIIAIAHKILYGLWHRKW